MLDSVKNPAEAVDRSKLAGLLNQPLAIGGKAIANRLVLAPMTFLGHVAFRQVLDEIGGCALMFSEMCSAGRIPQEDRFTSPYFRWRNEEADRLVIQMVGNKPHRMALAAQRIQDEGLWGVDINLGCCAVSVCKYNQGAALLKDTAAAAAMVGQIRDAIQCPLTVKFRTGWEDDPQIPVDFAKRLEDVGVDALTFHPRLAPDRRNRPPKWAYIGMVKDAVSIPVFGNGDVFDARGCLEMLQTTGCDGVALGRIAIARPWLFNQWTQGVEGCSSDSHAIALRLMQLCQDHFEFKSALRRYKRYGSYLAANFVFGNSLYNRIRNAPDFDAMAQVLDRFFKNDPRQLQRPNLNFLQ